MSAKLGNMNSLPVQDIERIAADFGARSVRIFGSYARGDVTADSDVDLLVTLEAGRDLLDLVGLTQELEKALKRKVDVVTENGPSPHLRDEILRTAKPLRAA